jgi:hypothetical protein
VQIVKMKNKVELLMRNEVFGSEKEMECEVIV